MYIEKLGLKKPLSMSEMVSRAQPYINYKENLLV